MKLRICVYVCAMYVCMYVCVCVCVCVCVDEQNGCLLRVVLSSVLSITCTISFFLCIRIGFDVQY